MSANPNTAQTSAAIFVVLRRMRIPLVVIIVIFAVSVLGLVLIPGGTSDEPWHIGFFDAFYVISYTATTIGFGEIPHPYNDAQRMWLTLSIYLTVIGWAYAIGTLLSLLQDRSFRHALAQQRFSRRVRRIGEPFWLIAGHGTSGEIITQRLDQLGRRCVVVDLDETQIDLLELGSYRSDVPGLVADAANPEVLHMAGLASPECAGVLALTDDEEVNLAIVMAASSRRPSVPVIAHASSPIIKQRMAAFGSPTIIDPFDRFGDHFRIALRAPASEQLAHWLAAETDTPLPQAAPLQPGRWIVCGYGRFGHELVRDLRDDGLDVVIVDDNPAHPDPDIVRQDSSNPRVLHEAGIDDAVGLIAGTDNDVTNMSIIAAARAANPNAFLVARQNHRSNDALFTTMQVDLRMVPSEVLAEEVLTYVSTPLLWQFLRHVSQQPDTWSRQMIDRLHDVCGPGSPELTRVTLDQVQAPAVTRWMTRQTVTVGDLLRDPEDRDSSLSIVPLLILRDRITIAAPPNETRLHRDDALLLAARPRASAALESTLALDSVASYVFGGRAEPTSAILRALWRSGSRS